MRDFRIFLVTAFFDLAHLRPGFASGRFFSSSFSASSSTPLAQTPNITPATTSECRRQSAYPDCARRTQGIHAARDPGIAEKAMHFFISSWIYCDHQPALLPPEYFFRNASVQLTLPGTFFRPGLPGGSSVSRPA
jgi:hypothetical protein